jgi:hypothetical protein
MTKLLQHINLPNLLLALRQQCLPALHLKPSATWTPQLMRAISMSWGIGGVTVKFKSGVTIDTWTPQLILVAFGHMETALIPTLGYPPDTQPGVVLPVASGFWTCRFSLKSQYRYTCFFQAFRPIHIAHSSKAAICIKHNQSHLPSASTQRS